VTDRSAFSEGEWKALAEAPLQITIALVAAGPHRPIAMVKEAAASARALAKPGTHGVGDELIAEIAKDASGHEARHDVESRHGESPPEMIESALAAVQTAVTALSPISGDEAAEVRAWYFDIAKAVAGASKAITSEEQQVLDRIGAVLQIATS
jgi:hypothetical protein